MVTPLFLSESKLRQDGKCECGRFDCPVVIPTIVARENLAAGKKVRLLSVNTGSGRLMVGQTDSFSREGLASRKRSFLSPLTWKGVGQSYSSSQVSLSFI